MSALKHEIEQKRKFFIDLSLIKEKADSKQIRIKKIETHRHQS
jgi:hypothetical protein